MGGRASYLGFICDDEDNLYAMTSARNIPPSHHQQHAESSHHHKISLRKLKAEEPSHVMIPSKSEPARCRPSSAKAATVSKSECEVKSKRPSSARAEAEVKSRSRPSSARSEVNQKNISWEIDLTDLMCTSGSKKKKKVKHGDSTLESKHKPEVSLPTPALMARRKVLDLNRWYCISRPQYKTSCGLSSLVSCWNYLFSSLGKGNHRPITQEEALTTLGFTPPFAEIRFGPFTGNKTLMRWYRQLNLHYGVRGGCFIMYKPQGLCQSSGMSADDALRQLKQGLQADTTAYIYHCENHYFCPIGYEETPLHAENAYRVDIKDDETETWVLIGETSRKHPSIHSKRWKDIVQDLNSESPDFYDIRRQHKGVQKRKTTKAHGNLHCIMAFTRSQLYKHRSKHKQCFSMSGVMIGDVDSNISLHSTTPDRQSVVHTKASTGTTGKVETHVQDSRELTLNEDSSVSDTADMESESDVSYDGLHGY